METYVDYKFHVVRAIKTVPKIHCNPTCLLSELAGLAWTTVTSGRLHVPEVAFSCKILFPHHGNLHFQCTNYKDKHPSSMFNQASNLSLGTFIKVEFQNEKAHLCPDSLEPLNRSSHFMTCKVRLCLYYFCREVNLHFNKGGKR